jgi:hypothetical protein
MDFKDRGFIYVDRTGSWLLKEAPSNSVNSETISIAKHSEERKKSTSPRSEEVEIQSGGSRVNRKPES